MVVLMAAQLRVLRAVPKVARWDAQMLVPQVAQRVALLRVALAVVRRVAPLRAPQAVRQFARQVKLNRYFIYFKSKGKQKK